jgi:transposase
MLKHLSINPLSPELNPICYLLALLAHDLLHVSKIRVNRDISENLFRFVIADKYLPRILYKHRT